jgi:hypothetical protein
VRAISCWFESSPGQSALDIYYLLFTIDYSYLRGVIIRMHLVVFFNTIRLFSKKYAADIVDNLPIIRV